MNPGLLLLCINAAAIAFLHTLVGPDHYVPFVAMARIRRWSAWRTSLVVLACGLGHVGSSVVLGLVGAACGVGLERLLHVESMRGNVTTWALIAFGAVYAAWGLRHAHRGRTHTHRHTHDGLAFHVHAHTHVGDHAHVHDAKPGVAVTPWILFTIFVFGPCEPVIPLVMFPAAHHDPLGIALVGVVFGAVTIATMLAATHLCLLGVRLLPWERMERYSHALAGAAILVTGAAVQAFGL